MLPRQLGAIGPEPGLGSSEIPVGKDKADFLHTGRTFELPIRPDRASDRSQRHLQSENLL